MYQIIEIRIAVDGTEDRIRDRIQNKGQEITRSLETNLVGHGFIPLRLMGANSIIPRIRIKSTHQEPEQLSIGLRGDEP